MRSSPGASRALRLAGSGSSSGSSRRIAVIVSAAVSRLKAGPPVAISNSTDPSEKMSERWSTGWPRTCSGDM